MTKTIRRTALLCALALSLSSCHFRVLKPDAPAENAGVGFLSASYPISVLEA